MVRTQVTVLTYAMRVVCSVNMRTSIGGLFSASRVVTIFAHTFSIELLICVRTTSRKLLVLAFWVILLRLF